MEHAPTRRITAFLILFFMSVLSHAVIGQERHPAKLSAADLAGAAFQNPNVIVTDEPGVRYSILHRSNPPTKSLLQACIGRARSDSRSLSPTV